MSESQNPQVPSGEELPEGIEVVRQPDDPVEGNTPEADVEEEDDAEPDA